MASNFFALCCLFDVDDIDAVEIFFFLNRLDFALSIKSIGTCVTFLAIESKVS